MDGSTPTPLRSFARDKQRKPKDSLTMDAIAADQAGTSYGKWKPWHPHTKEANEAALAKKPPKPPRPIYEITCKGCGKVFTTQNRLCKYCDDLCKYKKDGERYRRRPRKEAENTNNESEV